MAKKDKQEVTNNTFNIGNISKASSNEQLKKSNSNPKKSKLVPIRFKVHKDLVETFHMLRLEYSKSNKTFGLSNNEMFSIMVNFMAMNFEDNKILLNCPDDFKVAMIKPGKRKTTPRTVAFPNSESILFTIENEIADKYIDIMFSYITNDPNDSIYNDHHSRTYFFYDFIDFVNKHKKDLFKFKIE